MILRRFPWAVPDRERDASFRAFLEAEGENPLESYRSRPGRSNRRTGYGANKGRHKPAARDMKSALYGSSHLTVPSTNSATTSTPSTTGGVYSPDESFSLRAESFPTRILQNALARLRLPRF